MKKDIISGFKNNKKRCFETQYDQLDKAKISLGHPKHKGRSNRLDLITNQMLGIKASINSKSYSVCDISKTGFSYAERIPLKQNLSYKQVKLKVDRIANSNYGKATKFEYYFQGKSEGGSITATGVIRNHSLFLVLSPDEIRNSVTNHLQSKSIVRSHDPQGYFNKLDQLLEKTASIRKYGNNVDSLDIVMNTTFQNLVKEIGSTTELFDKLYQGFINKPIYVKYGVSVDNRKEALNLYKFAKLRSSRKLKWENDTNGVDKAEKLDLIKKLNERYSYQSFVTKIWINCLNLFGLDESTKLPKIEKVKVAQKLKEEKEMFDEHLEKLADIDFMEGDITGLQTYLSNGLYWYLIEIDKKYFDREVIKKELQEVISQTYDNCLKKVREAG